MELKSYQKKVMYDFNHYLELYRDCNNPVKAYNALWNEKGVPIGDNGIKPYNSILGEVPHICFKVPTGGGKTFLACNSIKTFFSYVSIRKPKIVVWLVPSEPIKEQTLKNLSNPEHYYRQKLNSDFNNNVEVLSKEQALMGQGFQPDIIANQLTILVLSYDSFKGRSEDVLRSFRQNSNLMQFEKVFPKGNVDIEKADDTSLFQIISNLNPYVIVDESHNAKSNLSIEMLKNFNPCFVLDLTATPQENSNIISIVDSHQLKNENMVKLPVLVYNRKTKGDVIADSVSLRNRLEQTAIKLKTNGEDYIRPIILFQAQSKAKEDNTTFEAIKKQLVEDYSIPPEQIAIKTADINELKDIDLMSSDCDIRYIITVNALKEGWDCPFAYILATVANRTSEVDVEQILGRVLRQPYTKPSSQRILNMSYVLTSSDEFSKTLQKIINALRLSGFSDKDYRCGNNEYIAPRPFEYCKPVTETPTNNSDNISMSDFINNETVNNIPDTKTDNVNDELFTCKGDDNVEQMIAVANQSGNNYDYEMQTNNDDIPAELSDKMKKFYICDDYKNSVKDLAIPQFYYAVPKIKFLNDEENNDVLLQKSHLTENFTLQKKDYDIDFGSISNDIVAIDVEENRDNPTYSKLDGADNEYYAKLFESQPQQKKIGLCKGLIKRRLGRIQNISDKDIRDYVDKIIDGMSNNELSQLEVSVNQYANKIYDKIISLLEEHRKRTFDDWIESDKIYCKPSYVFPKSITETQFPIYVSKSLYTTEFNNKQNNFETKVIEQIATLNNVLWWHRNIEKKEFCINGYINHYPDFIVCTKRNNIILVEAKGDDRDNSDSSAKARIGRCWEKYAGKGFKYFMVYDKINPEIDGCHNLDKFLSILKNL